MSKYSKSEKSYSIGVLDVVQIVFIILKLTDLVSWSWWRVLTPLWISLGLVALIGIIGGITVALEKKKG